MKAILFRKTGRPAVLKLEDVGAPRPQPGEALVQVYFAAVNPVDAKIRAGQFPAYTAPLPGIPGRDICGVVRSVALGKGAKKPPYAEGTEVFGMLDYARGAYAEYALGTARELAPVPKGLNRPDACTLGVAALTAWQGLFTHGRLKRGETVLIHGGAGGVGHFAVQFARIRGARVLVTAAGRDALWLEKLGVDQVIDYRKQRFEKEVSGVDLVLDLIGGEILKRSEAVLAPRRGRIVSTREGPNRMVVEPDRAQLEEIADLVVRKEVRPEIAAEIPLAEARAAHEKLAEGGFRGKLILAVTSPDIFDVEG